ncbi:MAG: hypothetical protein NC341_12525 [Blautia sp.]|nr:hypothetical protein [Blautia sp.]MCM1202029.1 hypothetical protein [Bacteroides fragilis]
MGNETIFYYVTEEMVTGHTTIAKPHFWRKVRLSSFVVEREEITLAAVMIPALSKGWKREKLLRLMRESMETHPLYSGNVRILIQPEVQRMLTEQANHASGISAARSKPVPSETFLSIGFPLTEKILRERFPIQRGKGGPESVVLLLGEPFFPEEQLRHFGEMIQPYLPRINALTVIYGAAEELDEEAEPGRLEEAVHEYAEELYYEYGLVSRILHGTAALQGGAVSMRRRNLPGGQNPVLFLDYGCPGTQPLRMLRDGDVYLDAASSEEKEALFRRKYRGIFYQSPRKYLDTMVKSGYDN